MLSLDIAPESIVFAESRTTTVDGAVTLSSTSVEFSADRTFVGSGAGTLTFADSTLTVTATVVVTVRTDF